MRSDVIVWDESRLCDNMEQCGKGYNAVGLLVVDLVPGSVRNWSRGAKVSKVEKHSIWICTSLCNTMLAGHMLVAETSQQPNSYYASELEDANANIGNSTATGSDIRELRAINTLNVPTTDFDLGSGQHCDLDDTWSQTPAFVPNTKRHADWYQKKAIGSDWVAFFNACSPDFHRKKGRHSGFWNTK
ncbi:hypothetical protein BDN71DRAFT_1436407 [Pleurotus eryngii]|uniref:Uncharacterized protein n=1 Tax=Pleurotus eryngii TaxID=5323 RepID=A0A9P6D9V7_PLEER|nr:hypothetical protein BDN71DRAFT_1436407 [Pleurotus eryngii]